MRIQSLTLIGSSLAVLRSAQVDAALEHWPANDCPPILTTTAQHVIDDDSILNNSQAAWVVLNQIETPRLHKLMGLLQEHHLPTMITFLDHPQQPGIQPVEGILITPPNATPAALCSMLRTLWNQAEIVHSLKTEVQWLQAHQSGLCEQIDKIDEELRLAAKIQREFLPQTLPSCPSVAFQALYRPAGYVSGDLYDAMRLDESHIGFFIADAAGHGVPAALMTMYIKRCLHTKEIDPETPKGYRLVPPDEAMARLNVDMVRQQAGKTRFATACYGVIHCHTLELTLARAGHPFPFLLRADGSLTTLEPDGMLLGVFPNTKYELAHARLNPGDRLVLYSDGFEMAFPQPDQDNGCVANTQYAKEFLDLANGPLDQAMQRLEHKLDQQIGSLNQRDDLTVLCLSANREPQEAVAHDQADRCATHTAA